MGLVELINHCVAFCVFVLIWAFLSICVLPHMTGKIGMPSLPPKELWSGLYVGLSKFSEYAVIVIIIVFLILWVIYNIIKRVIPGFILGMIGWTWSPFKELIQAGIFPFFDSIFGAIFSVDPINKRIQEVAEGVKGMLINGGIFLGNDLKSLGIPPNGKKFKEPPLVKVKPTTPSGQPSPISDKVKAAIDTSYNQCLQENLINITKEMKAQDVQSANLNNQMARVKCKLSQFKTSMEILGARA